MSKTKQVELEQAIEDARKLPPEDTSGQELTNPFDGTLFVARSRNHYEFNDGKPVAPPLDLNRPTIRQRIENLLNRDPGMLSRYMLNGPDDGSEGIEMDVPDDPEAPLTASEQNFLDMAAAEIAEQAPLPDDGLPRPQPASPASPPSSSEDQEASGSEAPQGADSGSRGGAGGGSKPPPAAAPAPRVGPQGGPPPSRTVPTR